MASPTWSGYVSRHYIKFQGYAPACIGLYLLVGAVGRVWLWDRLGLPQPVAELSNFGLWLGLYFKAQRRYRSVSSWFEGEKRGGRGVVVWGATMALLALLSLTDFGAYHATAVSMFVGAAWALLYRSQVGSVWGHYALLAPTLVIMGLASIADPGFPGAPLTPDALLGVTGAFVAICGIIDGRLFENSIKSRVGGGGR